MAKRRDLLLAFAASAAAASAEQEAAHPSAAGSTAHADTIYIPDRHLEKDRELLLEFLDEYSFAMVVSAQPSLKITNVPTVLSRKPGEWGSLWWHLAKNNQQNQAMQGPVTLVFHGPHGYISPNWFAGSPAEGGGRPVISAVPTWNFAVVHVTGTPRRITSEEELARGLQQLVQQNEARYGGGDAWRFEALPEAYLKGMRMGVIAYEMKIEKVEAKFKLGQERSAADRAGVLQGLARARKERDLQSLTKAYYSRMK